MPFCDRLEQPPCFFGQRWGSQCAESFGLAGINYDAWVFTDIARQIPNLLGSFPISLKNWHPDVGNLEFTAVRAIRGPYVSVQRGPLCRCTANGTNWGMHLLRLSSESFRSEGAQFSAMIHQSYINRTPFVITNSDSQKSRPRIPPKTQNFLAIRVRPANPSHPIRRRTLRLKTSETSAGWKPVQCRERIRLHSKDSKTGFPTKPPPMAPCNRSSRRGQIRLKQKD